MLRELNINNFRTFPFLKMKELSRINLIVGKNNTGKTSILDAIDFLLRGPISIIDLANRRGENIFIPMMNGYQSAPDVRLLFNGCLSDINAHFSIKGIDVSGIINEINCRIVEKNSNQNMIQFNNLYDQQIFQDQYQRNLEITTSVNGIENNIYMALGKEGGISIQSLLPNQSTKVRYISTWANVNPYNNAAILWSNIVAKPEEDLALEALKILEPSLERIAVAASPIPGIFARIKGSNERIPIGSFGDGIQHILILSTQLVSAAGGTLLIDEIDTGLHFNTMVKIWDFILSTAEKYDVQIFSTTHSQDCLRGLAIAMQNQKENSVTLHRIEQNNPESVIYTPNEIISATDNNIEVRY